MNYPAELITMLRLMSRIWKNSELENSSEQKPAFKLLLFLLFTFKF